MGDHRGTKNRSPVLEVEPPPHHTIMHSKSTWLQFASNLAIFLLILLKNPTLRCHTINGSSSLKSQNTYEASLMKIHECKLSPKSLIWKRKIGIMKYLVLIVGAVAGTRSISRIKPDSTSARSTLEVFIFTYDRNDMSNMCWTVAGKLNLLSKTDALCIYSDKKY